MKKVQIKKKKREKVKERKEKNYVERKVRERRKWTSVMQVRRTPSQKKEKRHKKRIMDMCPRVSRAHFSKIISESNNGRVFEGE
jgi:hypothetical protein